MALAVAVLAGLLIGVPPAGAAEVEEGAVVGFGAASGAAGEGVIGIATGPADGWWTTTAAGIVRAGAPAPHLGDLAGRELNRPIVGLAATPSGLGYWLVASDGGVFAFGDARFHGSTGDRRLNRPIVAMAATPSGAGYWLVASDGGVFSFGDARFRGSAGNLRLNEPVVGAAATPSGGGYWLVASDGGVFTFGDAGFHGAAGTPAAGIAATASGGGYWIAAPDGRVVARGDAAHRGDLAGQVRDASVVALARTAGGYRLAVGGITDSLDLWQPGGLRAPAQAWGLRVADRSGARATVWHRGNLDLVGVRRGATQVQAVPAGWRVPMATLAAEPRPSRGFLGPTVAAALERGEVAMGAVSARLRGARIGDVVDLRGWDGRTRARRIGAIADDARTGSAELVLSVADAAVHGFRRPFEVRVWGLDRAALTAALGAEPPPVRMGLDRSWAPTGRDGIASAVRLKQVLGEVSYRPLGGDRVALHPGWTGGITTQQVPVLGRVTCHRAMLPALRGALTEVARAGLGRTLGTYGGCYHPRRVAGGDSGGNLSRHSYGIALDLNIGRNRFGGRVEMHPRVVAIFRHWGFAWGGTWVRADGMHFEWVPPAG